ncbi:unnamed protein product [Linum trigynum]|uniref:Uncharacterized protein n=1 Tax=Linum trigynum TaxID=586398 RepID=A0AAV2DCN5_9ROSI
MEPVVLFFSHPYEAARKRTNGCRCVLTGSDSTSESRESAAKTQLRIAFDSEQQKPLLRSFSFAFLVG